jgi:hypothetical protein
MLVVATITSNSCLLILRKHLSRAIRQAPHGYTLSRVRYTRFFLDYVGTAPLRTLVECIGTRE